MPVGLGVCVPEEYGGSGLGIPGGSSLIRRRCRRSGAGMNGRAAMHMSIFRIPGDRARRARRLKRATLPRVVDGSCTCASG